MKFEKIIESYLNELSDDFEDVEVVEDIENYNDSTKKLVDAILWRLVDIREELMSHGIGGRNYHMDEWSTPIVNLDRVIKNLEDGIFSSLDDIPAIREQLIRNYRMDDWSTPIVNLDMVIKKLNAAN